MMQRPRMLEQLTAGVFEGYFRMHPPKKRAVVFVHGFSGDLRSTWESGTTGKLFQELLYADPELSDFDFLMFGYSTSFLGGPSVSNIAVQLKNQINDHLKGRQIVLVAHSYGGIVCMQYILNLLEKGEPLPVTGLVMYGTPTNGVELVNIAEASGIALNLKFPGAGSVARWFIRRNKQMQELAAHSEFIQDIHDKWIYRVANGGNSKEVDTKRRAFLNVRVVTGNEDWVVKEHSAKGIYGEIDWRPLDHGHVALVKPDSSKDDRYLALKTFLLECRDGLDPKRLARVKHFAESIWENRKRPAIGKWTFMAELSLNESATDSALAAAGFATSQYLCKYRMPLQGLSIPIGMSCGHAGRKAVWGTTPEPRYVHQILVDLLPESERGKLTKAVTDRLSTGAMDSKWLAFFPEVSVKINGISASPGKILPDNSGPNVGWLLRYFDLPETEARMVGEDVEFELTYQSIVPKSLTSFRVFYPWLVDGCECTIKVNANLQTFVPVYSFPKGSDVTPTPEPENPNFRSLTVTSDDLVLPDSAFWVFWDRKQEH